MDRKELTHKVIAKIYSPEEVYKSDLVQKLILRGTKMFPEYNLNHDEAEKVVHFVLDSLPNMQKSRKLFEKIYEGIR